MTREWKPGDVAMIPGVGPRMMTRRGWVTADGQFVEDGAFSGPRPLVVIDPEDREQAVDLALVYERLRDASPNGIAMQAALREFADPKPPKPDEPTGLGAVVEDAEGVRWVRTGPTVGDFHWCSALTSNSRPWRHVDAAKVLSEGVAHG